MNLNQYFDVNVCILNVTVLTINLDSTTYLDDPLFTGFAASLESIFILQLSSCTKALKLEWQINCFPWVDEETILASLWTFSDQVVV